MLFRAGDRVPGVGCGKKRARFWIQSTKVLEAVAISAGKMTMLHCTYPLAVPDEGSLNTAVRQSALTCSPDIDSAAATILASSLYSEGKSYAQKRERRYAAIFCLRR